MLVLTRKLGRLGWLLLVARGCLTSSTASRRSSCRDRGERGLAASGTFACVELSTGLRGISWYKEDLLLGLAYAKHTLNMEENVNAAYVYFREVPLTALFALCLARPGFRRKMLRECSLSRSNSSRDSRICRKVCLSSGSLEMDCLL